MGLGGQRHAPVDLPPGQRLGTHFTGHCVGPRSELRGGGLKLHHSVE
jgi:hypothetical protein